MKEPWEVYYESFEHKLRGADLSSMNWPDGDPRFHNVWEAFTLARESSAHHLIAAERWRSPEAIGLMDEFFRASLNWFTEAQASGTASVYTLREQLRHTWTDWQLRKSKGR